LFYDEIKNPNATLDYAFIPGISTFMGGGGLALTQKAKNQDYAWNLSTYLFNPRMKYLKKIGIGSGNPPPYDSASLQEQNQQYQFIYTVMRSAVPIQ
ncbi:hypothetical protein HK096_000461, partial [Nowakowskiella sp. JEL0078]